ncbi:NAD(P)/FAD-dependent oxidoreductase [Mesobacillus boroniphilus]|uniref:NAD(P)/FAD-dependent oxidoreductase n=1 Tax=Mesobacillus boroniphilus TaxID=308892 RepID=A0A944GV73_9BACI|nr:NAD(P)/FAD-dependent oxidoreductase [Mesobacillus boroniphilus]MBS8263182.1 NAD(P)/FAD-dependent oxidoreductase [Mesobacillus boroniphilus]
MQTPKIIILGAGYGGLITSRQLEKTLRNGEAEVTLINKHDYHYISTQLHKTGAGTASDEKITLHIPELLKTDKIQFKKGTVQGVDNTAKKVFLESGEIIDYDYLMIGLGFDVSTFGIPGVEENAFKIKSFRSTKAIYNHILRQFAAYKEDLDPSRLTFAVAGAGFTGIEMIGELIEAMPKLCLQYDIPVSATRIINIEASATVLPGFDKEAIHFTESYLKKNGVELMTSTKILECSPTSIILDNGEELQLRTLIWSGGVRGNTLLEKMDLPISKGRILIDKFLRVKGMENVFCIGDAALFMKDEGTPLPPTAQVAIQQAEVCGPNIVASLRGEQLKTFEYHHKGTVASIGNKAAVGKVFGLKINGLFAALMKQVIEARYLFVLGGPGLVIKQFLKVGKPHSELAISKQK